MFFYVLFISLSLQVLAQDNPYYSYDSAYFQSILEAFPKKNKEIFDALHFYLTHGKKSSLLEEVIGKILESPNLVSPDILEKALEIAYGFYPEQFYEKIILLKSYNISGKSKAIVYLYCYKKEPDLENSFKNIPLVTKSKTYLQESTQIIDPPLVDLFKHPFGKSNWVIFSIQTRSREYPGILVVRKPNGKFLRDGSGSIFHFAQLGRAVTNLPYFFISGHTPSGIYKISGKAISKTSTIGKTPALVLEMPVEISKAEFLGSNGKWSPEDILNLFPETWKVKEVLESYEAGSFGRTGIWMHGSTVNPKEFKGTSFFPLTPAFGCLISYEFWDKKFNNLYSSQTAFWDAIQNEKPNGYLIVVNRDLKRGILLEDIIEDILLAENYSSL